MNEDLIINIDDNNEIIIESNETVSSSKDYNDLYNKPQINEIELKGNKSLDDLGIQKKGTYANKRITNIEIDNLFK